MGTIARGTKSATGTVNFAASTAAKASEVNTDLNTIVTVINGNIDNDNVKSGAGIVASKLNLATIAQNIDNTGTLKNTGNVEFVGNFVADNIQLTTDIVITAILDEDDMASDSAVSLPTQQSVKAYVTANKGAAETAWTDYSATSTIVGWTSFTGKQIYTKKIGKTVFVSFDILGTSNATGITFTLPYTSAAGFTSYEQAFGTDNGTEVAASSRVALPGGSATVTVTKDQAGAAWTNSGTKRVAGQFFYQEA